MSKIQVSAKMKINHSMLEEFKKQVAICLSEARDKDPGMLQYDWFISTGKIYCEIRETH